MRLLAVEFIEVAVYVEWLSNVVPVIKKNGKIRVCTDFRNLNLASPKDEYHMPIAEVLIDSLVGYMYKTFVDGNAGYNQIFIANEDVPKTAFRCPRALGIYQWKVMPFGLKNAGATYQRAMNYIFHDLIGDCLEVYIDDVVVKSHSFEQHLRDLEKAFILMRHYKLKLNPLKCTFAMTMTKGNFLGFTVHEHGIEVDREKPRPFSLHSRRPIKKNSSG